MIIDALKILSSGKNLDFATTKEVMYQITEGKATEAQIASFLTALKMKGETVDEITACAEVMKEKCIKIKLPIENTLDIVGTGGDMSNTFNISTTTAFVAAAGGVPVAKHGNKAFTSKSGAIDVLEALGINVNKTPDDEINLFKKLNVCFMHAHKHHPVMQFATKVRRDLGFRTLFNILGPLTNPASATSQLFGVYDEKLVNPLCKVISNLGVKNVLVVFGKDGIDEASLSSETVIAEGRNGNIKNYTITPEQFGFKRCQKSDITGGDASFNAQIIRDIFSGKLTDAKKDIIVLNSALAFYTFGKTNSINEGIEYAENIIKTGAAQRILDAYIKLSNEE